MTIKKKSIKKIQSPIRVGNKVMIRSVTHYYTGEIVLLLKDEIILKDAAWIADTSLWSDALKSGTLNEVEPYPDGVFVAVGRGAVVDVSDWNHDLPRVQK
jgi:hypothetical protein